MIPNKFKVYIGKKTLCENQIKKNCEKLRDAMYI